MLAGVRDAVLRILGWRLLLLTGDPCVLDRWLWLRRQLRAAGISTTVLDAGRLRQVHRWAKTVAALARILRSRRPDLVLNWSAKTHLYGAPAAMLAGIADRVTWWQQSIPMGVWIDRAA